MGNSRTFVRLFHWHFNQCNHLHRSSRSSHLAAALFRSRTDELLSFATCRALKSFVCFFVHEWSTNRCDFNCLEYALLRQHPIVNERLYVHNKFMIISSECPHEWISRRRLKYQLENVPPWRNMKLINFPINPILKWKWVETKINWFE